MKLSRWHLPKSPLAAALAAILLIGTVSATSVFAYLKLSAGPVKDTLTKEVMANPQPLVGRYGVSVPSTMTYGVYVRAALIVTWKDTAGVTLGDVPTAGTDYILNTNNTDWIAVGGYYYYKKPVLPGESTTNLLLGFTPFTQKTGFTLSCDSLYQVIQAVGETDGNAPVPAVTDAWGVTVDSNGNIVG